MFLLLRIRCQFGQALQMHMYAIYDIQSKLSKDDMKSAYKHWVCAVFAINYIYCVFYTV